MGKIKKAAWEQLKGYLNMGKGMAAGHDAAMVLVAVAEVQGETTPKAAWVTSGVVDQQSIERSEAMIAMLEMAAQSLRDHHLEIFGREAQPRGYKPQRPR